MKNLKAVLVILLVFICMPIFANGAQETKELKNDVTVLKMFWWEDRFVDTMNEYINEFESINPNIKVELEIIPFETFYDKIPLMIAGNQDIDLFFLISGKVQQFAENEALYNLNGLIDPNKINLFNAGQINLCTYDKKLISLPFTAAAHTTWVNLDMLEKAGVSIPKTINEAWSFDDFSKILTQIKEANNLKYALTYNSREFFFMPFFYANGSKLVNSELTGSAFNSNESREVLEYMEKLTSDALISPPKLEEAAGELFFNGDAALYMSGTWDLGNIKKFVGDKFKYSTIVFPKGEFNSVAIGGDYIGISKNTKHPKEAAKFLDFLTNESVLNDYVTKNSYLSPRTDIKPNYGDDADYMIAPMNQSAEISSEFTLHRGLPNFGQYSQILNSTYEATVLGVMPVDEAVIEIDKAIEKAFK